MDTEEIGESSTCMAKAAVEERDKPCAPSRGSFLCFSVEPTLDVFLRDKAKCSLGH